jgi:hypothetical protein
MKGKCPFNRIKCEECVLYRSGLRYYPDKIEPIPFTECAINIAVDCLENLVQRSVGQQQATEQTRNAMVGFTELIKGVANAENRERSYLTVGPNGEGADRT